MKKIILFGAGVVGQEVCDFMQKAELTDLIQCFCDNSVELDQECQVNGIRVYNYETCKNMDNIFVITSTKYRGEIELILQRDDREYFQNINEWASFYGVNRKPEWTRAFCAWFHIEQMNDYFNEAESDFAMNIFGGENSAFLRMFRRLDLDNVIELAVGRGRHIRKYEQEANHIVLVDILQENIDFCRERFRNIKKIDYYCNNGYSLSQLQDDEYTALFTYDAMVHFEMMDIFTYLKDIHRVLKRGGMALFHHSNNVSDYKNTFVNTVGGRNYMSKDIFAYLSYRAGFDVVEQQLIDWGEKDLDCLSLVRKV